MARKVEVRKNVLILKDNDIEGFLERIVTPFGTSAKADVPRKYIGKRVYVIVTKKKV
jgi:putative transposon-encoded protein